MALLSSRIYISLRNSWRILQNVKCFLFETPEPHETFPLALPWQPCGTEMEENNGMFDGFLWAVPKKRVSLERRLTRRVAHTLKWSPKKNFLVCNECGHYHLAHTVCANCYARVRKETEEMKHLIQEKLKLDPIEKEVIVIYENDKKPRISKNELLVEIPKERPKWFCKNLLSKGNEHAITSPKTTSTDENMN